MVVRVVPHPDLRERSRSRCLFGTRSRGAGVEAGLGPSLLLGSGTSVTSTSVATALGGVKG